MDLKGGDKTMGVPSPTRSERCLSGRSAALLLALGCLLLCSSPLFPLQRSWDRESAGPETASGSTTRATWKDDGRRIDLWLHGAVDFDDDFTAILSIGPGGSVKVRERVGLRIRSVTVRPKGRDLEYRYASMGLPRDFDANARTWYHQLLPEAMGRTGIGARKRARRILEEEGADGLLEHLSTTGTDRTRTIGLEVLVANATLSADQIDRSAALVTGLVDSEYRRAGLFHSLVEENWLPSVAGGAFFEAVRSLDSENRRAALLDLAMRTEPPSDELMPSYFGILDAFASEHRRSGFLGRLLRTPELSPSNLRLAVRVIGDLPTESRRLEHLETLAPWLEPGTPLLDAFFIALAELPSEHRRFALIELLTERGGAFVLANGEPLLDTVASLPSEARRQELLLLMMRPMLASDTGDERLTGRFLELVSSLPSEHRVVHMLDSALVLDQLSEANLRRLLKVTTQRVTTETRRVPLVDEISGRLLAFAA